MAAYTFQARTHKELMDDIDNLKCHVGTSAPSYVYVGKLWYDSTSGTADLKVCTAVAGDGTPTWAVCFTA